MTGANIHIEDHNTDAMQSLFQKHQAQNDQEYEDVNIAENIASPEKESGKEIESRVPYVPSSPRLQPSNRATTAAVQREN